MKCKFCELLEGKKTKHKNNFPFLKLHETKRTVSFLSIDFPEKEDGHVLIITKKHFQFLEDIPKSTLHELIEHTSLIVKATRKTHQGCNILLNDGKAAEQTVPHTHFHIFPRDPNDKMQIEVWKRKKITEDSFRKLHKSIKRRIKKYLVS
jgi:histidine triad (HIT) family protein